MRDFDLLQALYTAWHPRCFTDGGGVAQGGSAVALKRDAQRAAIDRQDQALDFKSVVKLFTPDAQCTWLLTEIDEGTDLAFGLCDLGMGEPELGFVSLIELAPVRGKLGLPVERDLHFEADQPISAYAAEARERGRIVT